MFWRNSFVKMTRQSLYKAKSLACSLANMDTPVAATLQIKSSGGMILVGAAKLLSKRKCSKELFRNNFGQDGTLAKFTTNQNNFASEGNIPCWKRGGGSRGASRQVLHEQDTRSE